MKANLDKYFFHSEVFSSFYDTYINNLFHEAAIYFPFLSIWSKRQWKYTFILRNHVPLHQSTRTVDVHQNFIGNHNHNNNHLRLMRIISIKINVRNVISLKSFKTPSFFVMVRKQSASSIHPLIHSFIWVCFYEYPF